MSLFWYVLFPIILALIGYILEKKYTLAVIITGQGYLLFMAFHLFFTVKQQGMVTESLGHYPKSVGLTLYADRLSAVLILLTTFLFISMLIFNAYKPYMNKIFLFLFLVLHGLLHGLFLSRDFFNLYAIIEVSTIVVSILIMFKKDSGSIYDGIVYFFTNMVAMAFYLLGIGYLYKIFGTLDFKAIESSLHLIESSKDLYLPYALIMTAIGLKAALMPLFSYMPRAYRAPSAPSIVSAILSGLYVKGGLYLLIRFKDLFDPVINTNTLFLLIGFATAIIGFIFAISQTDIKLILAYSTVSQIGFIVFSLCIGSPASYWGGLYHLVNHAIFKSVLFLTAGILIENYHTRNINNIRGVFLSHPFVSIMSILSILGITGAPLFNGSISKYMIQSGTSQQVWLDYGLLLINWGTILIFMKYIQMFFGPSPLKKPLAHPVTWNQKLTLSFLSGSCFIGGIAGTWLIQFLFGLYPQITVASYTQKALIYLVSVFSAYLFYRYLFGKIRFFQTIRELELNMNQIVLSFVIFFFGFLSYLHLW